MSQYNIYTPNVSILHANYGAPIDVSLGGVITNIMAACFTFVLYGDLWFFTTLTIGGGTPATRVMLRVKSNGQFCWYSDAPKPNGLNWAGVHQTTRQAPILNGNVITSILGADLRTIIAPSFFINGGWIYVPSYPFSVPQPCGINQQANFVLSSNGKALVEYTQGFAINYNLWAATGSFINGQFVIGNGGYVGNFPNGVDPIVQNSALNDLEILTYGTYANQVSYVPFGLHGKNVEFKTLFGNFDVFYTALVLDGSLTCDGKGLPIPSASINYFRILDHSSIAYNNTQFYNTSEGSTGACDFTGVFCIGNLNGEIDLFDGTNFIAIKPIGMPAIYTGNVGVINNIAILLSGNRAPEIFISQPLTLPPLAPPPIVNPALASSLLNWHRPISTRGLFKT